MTQQPADWFVYIVQCADGTLYTGVTTDLQRRVQEHNGLSIQHANTAKPDKTKNTVKPPRSKKQKGAAYTAMRRPVDLVYYETSESRSTACRREAEIKKLRRAQKQVLISQGVADIDKKR